jgi:NADH dehydrogenase
LTLDIKKFRIVIIGANFAGLSAASKLSKDNDVTVIDSRQDFQWTPNIHEILSQIKEENSLSLNLATIINRLGHRFVNKTVTNLNSKMQTITLDNNKILDYDILLITSGHIRSNYNIKGADQYAFGFRTAADVRQIHNNIEAALNSKKNTININIVGGGFTGVEVLGELLRKYATNERLHINVIDSAHRLVSALPERLSDDIISQCESDQLSFHFNKKIIAVKKSCIEFSDKTTVKSDLTIWSAGTKLPKYLEDINTQNSSSGLTVNAYLQTSRFDNIFVAGDSASLPKSLPKQASVALDMGQHAAINITKFCAAKPLKPFKTGMTPVLLSLGDINTYFIQGRIVLASPLLAAGKEAVYQFYMAKLSKLLPLEQGILGIASRVSLSTEKLLLAEMLKLKPKILLRRSKVL